MPVLVAGDQVGVAAKACEALSSVPAAIKQLPHRSPNLFTFPPTKVDRTGALLSYPGALFHRQFLRGCRLLQ